MFCFFPSVLLSDRIAQICFEVLVHSTLRYWCCPGFLWTSPVYFEFTYASDFLLFYFSSKITFGAQVLSIVTLLSTPTLVVVVVLGSVSSRLITLGILLDLVLNILLGRSGRNGVVLGVVAVGNIGAVLGLFGQGFLSCGWFHQRHLASVK